MLEINPIYPAAIYDVAYDSRSKTYYLNPYNNHFVEPVKYYGSTIKYSQHFFNTFKNGATNMGILFVGAAGSGKTLMAEKISNIALSEGYMVVRVVNVKVDIHLINYLDSLSRAVILLDEFGKNFYYDIQNKMLSMLSSTTSGKKLFILTENTKHSISPLILNRPGRVRYRLYFGKVTPDAVAEYCRDYQVERSFTKDLKELYEKSATFSFDHLQAIVSEHLITRTMSIKELLSILNLDVLGGSKIISLVEVIDTKTNKPIDFVPMNIPYVNWYQGDEQRRYSVNTMRMNQNQPDTANQPPFIINNGPGIIDFTSKDVTKSVGDNIEIVKGNVLLKFIITDS